MRAFGLELRRTGTVHTLWNDVDTVLDNAGINREQIGLDMQRDTVAHALQHMIKENKHFSVSTVDSCAKVSAIIIPAERQTVYEAMHCINWSEMLPEFRQRLVAMVLDDFRGILNAKP